MKGFKKVICLLLSVALILPTISAVALAAPAENVLFSYDFSDLTAGQKVTTNSSKANMFSSLHGNVSTSPAVIAGYGEKV